MKLRVRKGNRIKEEFREERIESEVEESKRREGEIYVF